MLLGVANGIVTLRLTLTGQDYGGEPQNVVSGSVTLFYNGGETIEQFTYPAGQYSTDIVFTVPEEPLIYMDYKISVLLANGCTNETEINVVYPPAVNNVQQIS